MQFIEPLEADIWFRAVGALAERGCRSADDLEEQLRHAYHLTQMAPLPIRYVIRPACEEVRFEQLLACEAFESAALALMPPPLKYSIARGGDRMVLATVALPGDDIGHFAAAEELASALLQSWLRSMLALEPQADVRARPIDRAEGAGQGWPWGSLEASRKSTG